MEIMLESYGEHLIEQVYIDSFLQSSKTIHRYVDKLESAFKSQTAPNFGEQKSITAKIMLIKLN